tara:strand:- start:158 stop:337 length:180 start_codon:yes stop_codon:yes gene_type:complete
MDSINTFEVNASTIDQMFYLGFPSVGIYNAWIDDTTMIEYIMNNHLDEELEVFLGIKAQ